MIRDEKECGRWARGDARNIFTNSHGFSLIFAMSFNHQLYQSMLTLTISKSHRSYIVSLVIWPIWAWTEGLRYDIYILIFPIFCRIFIIKFPCKCMTFWPNWPSENQLTRVGKILTTTELPLWYVHNFSFPFQVSKDSVIHQINEGKKLMTSPSTDSFALIIDGKSLGYALEDDVKSKFLQLAMDCASVICCRSSPKQKALVSLACFTCEVTVAQCTFLILV